MRNVRKDFFDKIRYGSLKLRNKTQEIKKDFKRVINKIDFEEIARFVPFQPFILRFNLYDLKLKRVSKILSSPSLSL